jgi:hypothetical protein
MKASSRSSVATWSIRDDQSPAAGWRVGKQYPDRLAQSSGKMRDGGIHGDQQIEIGQNRGGVGKVVEVRSEVA